MQKLKNRVAVITGGGGYIGAGIAAMLAESGARTAVVDIRETIAQQACESIRQAGGDAAAWTCDITNYDDAERIMGEIAAQFGGIDILVNAAGGSARSQIAEFHQQDIRVVKAVIDLNLYGTLNCIRAAVPYLIAANYGKIVNIGSTVGVGGLAGCVDYAAAKGAIFAATKTLAMELGKFNITVNVVSPGIVQRPEEARTGEALAELVQRKSWVVREGRRADIAHMVCYLCAPESDYITGQNVIVDGGRSLGLKGS